MSNAANTTLVTPLALPLTGSSLIEASAGTGKTFTIAAQYVRFILAHIERINAPATRSTPLLPPDILVVTFTKAATEELKDRIRRRLVEAASCFYQQSTQPNDPFLSDLRAEFAEANWPLCAYALQTASEWMDEASVKTIHSWCQSLLREHAFTSGSLFNQKLLSDLEQIKLEAARDYWRNFIYPLHVDDYKLVAAEVGGPDTLLGVVNALWSTALAENPGSLSITDLSTQVEADYQRILSEHYHHWSQYLEQWITLIDDAEVNKLVNKPRTYNSKKVRSDFAGIQAWLALSEGEALANPPVVKKSLIDNYGWKNFPSAYDGPLPDAELLSALDALAKGVASKPGIKGPLAQHAASWIKQRFEQRMYQDAAMGFDDIIRQARAALCTQGEASEQLAQMVREQYPVAMIDEFQDTDPDQYAIFNAVYQIAQQRTDVAVFLIGDPKQAIYAFRGADIYTYLQARVDTAGRHYTLATNFRSTDNMVRASNAMFSHAENTQAKRAFLFADGQLPFVEVSAKGHGNALLINGEKASSALNLWTSLNEPDASKAISKEIYRQDQAQRYADFMAYLLNSAQQNQTGIKDENGQFTALQSKDLAILVSTHAEGHLMQQKLRERGIASVYLSDRNSVYDAQVARDLLLVLLACITPNDRTALTNALYSELINFSLHELEQLQADDLAWDTQVDQFYSLAETWQKQGVLAMIHQLIHEFSIASRFVGAQALEQGGDRYMTDLLHLAELLQQAAMSLDGEHALIRHLHEHIYQKESNAQPPDEQIVRLESDAELVQIITIHKSKGLEYSLVFLPFISACRPVSTKDTVFHYHDEEGVARTSMVPQASIVNQADEERLGEDIRKLYVALTRAKYACWASLAPVGDWSKSALAYLAGASEMSDAAEYIEHAHQVWGNEPGLKVCMAPETSDWTEQAMVMHVPRREAANKKTFVARQMPSGHRFKHWWIASYSALKYGALREPESALEATLLEDAEDDQLTDEGAYSASQGSADLLSSIHTIPRGAGPGTFLHNLLDDAAQQGFATVAENDLIRAQLLEKRCRYGQWKALMPILDQWLKSYLLTAFPLPDGADVKLAELQSYKAEPEFWFAVNGVNAQRIDDLVSKYILPAHARPALQSNYLNGMLKGFIDLVFEYQGRYYVADYKSNYLGADDSAYTQPAMREKILSSRYDMQYVLYTLALHKLLKARLGNQYDYDTHIGGVVYLFLRGYNAPGAGAFVDKPQKNLILELETYFVNDGTHERDKDYA